MYLGFSDVGGKGACDGCYVGQQELPDVAVSTTKYECDIITTYQLIESWYTNTATKINTVR